MPKLSTPPAACLLFLALVSVLAGCQAAPGGGAARDAATDLSSPASSPPAFPPTGQRCFPKRPDDHMTCPAGQKLVTQGLASFCVEADCPDEEYAPPH